MMLEKKMTLQVTGLYEINFNYLTRTSSDV